MVELPGRLIVPAAPCLSAVQRDQRALVDSRNLAVWIVRIDPQDVEIVAGRVPLQRNEMRPAVVREKHDRVADPYPASGLRVSGDSAEIPAAVVNALVAGDLGPA